MKDGYSFHANYDSLDEITMTTRQPMKPFSPAVVSISRPSSGMVGPWAAKDSQEFMAITPDRTDLSRWLILTSLSVPEEIPADVLEEIKAELSS